MSSRCPPRGRAAAKYLSQASKDEPSDSKQSSKSPPDSEMSSARERRRREVLATTTDESKPRVAEKSAPSGTWSMPNVSHFTDDAAAMSILSLARSATLARRSRELAPQTARQDLNITSTDPRVRATVPSPITLHAKVGYEHSSRSSTPSMPSISEIEETSASTMPSSSGGKPKMEPRNAHGDRISTRDMADLINNFSALPEKTLEPAAVPGKTLAEELAESDRERQVPRQSYMDWDSVADVKVGSSFFRPLAKLAPWRRAESHRRRKSVDAANDPLQLSSALIPDIGQGLLLPGVDEEMGAVPGRKREKPSAKAGEVDSRSSPPPTTYTPQCTPPTKPIATPDIFHTPDTRNRESKASGSPESVTACQRPRPYARSPALPELWHRTVRKVSSIRHLSGTPRSPSSLGIQAASYPLTRTPTTPSQRSGLRYAASTTVHDVNVRDSIIGSPQSPDGNVTPWDFQRTDGVFIREKEVTGDHHAPDSTLHSAESQWPGEQLTTRVPTKKIRGVMPPPIDPPKKIHNQLISNWDSSRSPGMLTSRAAASFPSSPCDPDWDATVMKIAESFEEDNARSRQDSRGSAGEASRSSEDGEAARRETKLEVGRKLIARLSNSGYIPVKPIYMMNSEEDEAYCLATNDHWLRHQNKAGLGGLFKKATPEDLKTSALQQAFMERQGVLCGSGEVLDTPETKAFGDTFSERDRHEPEDTSRRLFDLIATEGTPSGINHNAALLHTDEYPPIDAIDWEQDRDTPRTQYLQEAEVSTPPSPDHIDGYGSTESTSKRLYVVTADSDHERMTALRMLCGDTLPHGQSMDTHEQPIGLGIMSLPGQALGSPHFGTDAHLAAQERLTAMTDHSEEQDDDATSAYSCDVDGKITPLLQTPLRVRCEPTMAGRWEGGSGFTPRRTDSFKRGVADVARERRLLLTTDHPAHRKGASFSERSSPVGLLFPKAGGSNQWLDGSPSMKSGVRHNVRGQTPSLEVSDKAIELPSQRPSHDSTYSLQSGAYIHTDDEADDTFTTAPIFQTQFEEAMELRVTPLDWSSPPARRDSPEDEAPRFEESSFSSNTLYEGNATMERMIYGDAFGMDRSRTPEPGRRIRDSGNSASTKYIDNPSYDHDRHSSVEIGADLAVSEDNTRCSSGACREAPGQMQTSGLKADDGVEVDEMIQHWQKGSPFPIPAESRIQSIVANNAVLQHLRSELQLPQLKELGLGELAHPKHPYAFNTTKIMCWGVHDDNNKIETSECVRCSALCCAFASKVLESQNRTFDDAGETVRSVNEETANMLRCLHPTGIEEYDTFLTCSECSKRVCPDCALVCREHICRQVVCVVCARDERCLWHSGE